MSFLLAPRASVIARLFVLAFFAVLATGAAAQPRSADGARVEAASSPAARMALDTHWNGTRVWVGAVAGEVVVRLADGRGNVALTFSPEAVRTWAAQPTASESNPYD